MSNSKLNAMLLIVLTALVIIVAIFSFILYSDTVDLYHKVEKNVSDLSNCRFALNQTIEDYNRLHGRYISLEFERHDRRIFMELSLCRQIQGDVRASLIYPGFYDCDSICGCVLADVEGLRAAMIADGDFSEYLITRRGLKDE